jgi:hypothetical protein
MRTGRRCQPSRRRCHRADARPPGDPHRRHGAPVRPATARAARPSIAHADDRGDLRPPGHSGHHAHAHAPRPRGDRAGTRAGTGLRRGDHTTPGHCRLLGCCRSTRPWAPRRARAARAARPKRGTGLHGLGGGGALPRVDPRGWSSCAKGERRGGGAVCGSAVARSRPDRRSGRIPVPLVTGRVRARPAVATPSCRRPASAWCASPGVSWPTSPWPWWRALPVRWPRRLPTAAAARRWSARGCAASRPSARAPGRTCAPPCAPGSPRSRCRAWRRSP